MQAEVKGGFEERKAEIGGDPPSEISDPEDANLDLFAPPLVGGEAKRRRLPPGSAEPVGPQSGEGER